MKTKTMVRTLTLNKTDIARLGNGELRGIHGGNQFLPASERLNCQPRQPVITMDIDRTHRPAY